jgi:hypothetical protein
MAPIYPAPGRDTAIRIDPSCWGSLAWCRQLRQASGDCPSCTDAGAAFTRQEYYP